MIVPDPGVFDAINERQSLCSVNRFRTVVDELLRVTQEILKSPTVPEYLDDAFSSELSFVLKVGYYIGQFDIIFLDSRVARMRWFPVRQRRLCQL